jgi:hypothetical protein
LWTNTFTLCAVVVSARLVVDFAENGVPLPVLDFTVCFQVGELPLDE